MNGNSARYFNHSVLEFVDMLRNQRIPFDKYIPTANKSHFEHLMADPNNISPDICHNESVIKSQIGQQDKIQLFENIFCSDCLQKIPLYRYSVVMKPLIWSFNAENKTQIKCGAKNYTFDGFDVVAHFPIDSLPPITLKLSNMMYSLHLSTIQPLNLTNDEISALSGFSRFLYHDILELFDFYSFTVPSRLHIVPRFINNLNETLSIGEILKYLIHSFKLIDDVVTDEKDLKNNQNDFKGAIAINPSKKPSALRIDRIELQTEKTQYTIVHFAIRPKSLTYFDDYSYKSSHKKLNRIHIRSQLKTKESAKDSQERIQLVTKMMNIKQLPYKRKTAAVCFPASGFYLTGLFNDVTHTALLLSELILHIYNFCSLSVLESSIKYKFNSPALLLQALTPFRETMRYVVNVDQFKNSLSNVGNRFTGKPIKENGKSHRKGVLGLMKTMSSCDNPPQSPGDELGTNERFEFLGDAVLEVIVSTDLFAVFPAHNESVLTGYRSALVGNANLFKIAKKLELDKFIIANKEGLTSSALEHVLADALEALVGAIFVDSSSLTSTRIFVRNILFGQMESQMVNFLDNPPICPLLDDNSDISRKLLNAVAIDKSLDKLECSTGIIFKRKGLLAQALHKGGKVDNIFSVNNERFEYLGDSLLKFVIVEYLYNRFPTYSEGPLSILKGLLVSASVQSEICDELGLCDYQLTSRNVHNLNSVKAVKHKADLFEAFVAALYLDSGGFMAILTLCKARIFSKLNTFIYNQDWNDPKSLLRQCCHIQSLIKNSSHSSPAYELLPPREDSPDIFRTSVSFMGRQLAVGFANTVRQSQINAAKNALELDSEKFQLLVYRQRLLDKGLKRRYGP